MPEKTSDLFEIMQTTRSMRRLKPDPVPAALIRKILEAGTFAPSGGNMQRWRFLVIRDAKIKQTVRAYYKRAWDEVVSPRYRMGDPAPAPVPSGSHGCSTQPNILPTISTKLPSGSCHVCMARTRLAQRDRQSIRQFRTCFWRQERSASGQR